MISIFIFSDSQNLEQFYRTINLIFYLAWTQNGGTIFMIFWPPCYSDAKYRTGKKLIGPNWKFKVKRKRM